MNSPPINNANQSIDQLIKLLQNNKIINKEEFIISYVTSQVPKVNHKDLKLIEKISQLFNNDKNLIIAAIKHNPFNIKFVPEIFCNDTELITIALKQDPNSFSVAPIHIRNNPKIIHFIIDSFGKSNGTTVHMSFIKNTSKSIKNNKEILKKILHISGETIYHASKEIKDNLELATIAIQQSCYALAHVSPNLQNNPDFVKKAIQQDGITIQYASPSLKNNKELAIIALSNNGLALQYLSENLKNNKSIVTQAIEGDGWAINFAPDHFKNNKNLALIAISNSLTSLKFCSTEIQNLCSQNPNDPISVLEEAIAKEKLNNLKLKINPSSYNEPVKRIKSKI